jgi:hypothetical protein
MMGRTGLPPQGRGEQVVFDETARVVRGSVRLCVRLSDSGGCVVERHLKHDDGMTITCIFVPLTQAELYDLATADEYYKELRTRYEAIQDWFARTVSREY